MGQKRWKKKGRAPYTPPHEIDPITRCIALHGDYVAVCAGRCWRVVNLRSGAVLHASTAHEAPVRGLDFSPDGQYLLTCADDKTACVWRTSDWACLHRLKSSKKATACTFSADSRHVFFADRFGDVLCGTTLPATAADAPPAPADAAAAAAAGTEGASDAAAAAPALPAAVEANLLLGHLSSIVSSLACCSSSAGQPLLVSTDKDGKVRASVLPADPTKGSFEIWNYCLGHTRFVTSAAAVPPAANSPEQQQQQQHLLVSGAGDGTVRLWDVDTGKELSCFVASEQPPSLAFQQQQQEAGVAYEEQQQQQGNPEGEEADGAAAAAAADGQEDEQQEEQQDEQQQDEQQGGQEEGEQGPAAAAAAAGAQDDDGAADGQQQDDAEAGEDGEASKDAGRSRVHKLREACCAVLSVAVSPDGTTVAAAVEGQQELQLLSLDAATQQLQLQQKLSLTDVANPAAVAFDGQGRLWVVGGVLARDTQSAHVGVAAKSAELAEWQPVTSDVLSSDLRQALERRVQDEEERQQQQQQDGQQGDYYFANLKKAVYVTEGGPMPKKPKRNQADIDRLRALTAAKGQQQQQQQEQEQQQKQEQE